MQGARLNHVHSFPAADLAIGSLYLALSKFQSFSIEFQDSTGIGTPPLPTNPPPRSRNTVAGRAAVEVKPLSAGCPSLGTLGYGVSDWRSL